MTLEATRHEVFDGETQNEPPRENRGVKSAITRPFHFSWPYLPNVQGEPYIGWYPVNPRGIAFDLESRRTVTAGGWTNQETEVTKLPSLTQTDGPLRSMVMIADDDALLYINASEVPVYLPGGCPVKMSLEGVSRLDVRPNYGGEAHLLEPLIVGFGLMATFSNRPDPPEIISRFPLWYQRTIMQGGQKSVNKDTAINAVDTWKAFRLAPVFSETPTVGSNSHQITEANILNGDSWAHSIRTSHLSHKVFTVENDSTSDGPIKVRLQGVLTKGADVSQVVVDDPATGTGIKIGVGETVRISTEEQYGQMRLLIANGAEVAQNDAAVIGIDMAARFAAGA